MNRNLQLTNDPQDIVRFADLADCLNPCPTILYQVFGMTRMLKSSENLDFAKIEYTYNNGFIEVIKRFLNNKTSFMNSDPHIRRLVINDILERLHEKEIINPISISLN